MEPKQHTPSVIAKLMGFQPPKPVQKQQRVLSQSYIQRAASLGVPRKIPFNKRPPFRLNAEEHEEIRNVFQEKKLFFPKNENLYVHVKEKKTPARKVAPGMQILPSSPVFSCWKDKCRSSFYRSVGSYVEIQARKQILSERCKVTKKSQEVQTAHKAKMSTNLIFPDDKDVNLKYAAIRNTKGIPNYKASHNKRYLGPVQHTSRFRISRKEVGFGNSGPNCMKSQPMPCLELNNHKDHQLETDSISTGANDDFSQIYDNLSQQDVLAGNYEEGSVSSFFGTDSDSLMNIEDYKESYQPSPISVLEPFPKDDIASGLPQQIDFLKLEFSETYSNDISPGLQQQIDFLNMEYSETYSDGSGMIVSSDEETGERYNENLQETENTMSLCKVEESRDFSYIIDVLHKAGYPDTGFNPWNSPEHAIDRSVFEKLEKKYGEQKCWKRSERRLLFDRINLGLADILQPPLGTSPLSRKLGFKQNLNEELWLLLEKEASSFVPNQNVFTKDDKWLDLRDDIEAIGREIECSLIDELAAEFFGME